MAQPRSKTEKKIDKNVRQALTKVCEQFLGEIEGFQWLTHQASYSDFPGSLLIICVFDTDAHQQRVLATDDADKIAKIIQSELLKIGVKLKLLKRQIIFDSEDKCHQQHEGNWVLRLSSLEKRSVTRKNPQLH